MVQIIRTPFWLNWKSSCGLHWADILSFTFSIKKCKRLLSITFGLSHGSSKNYKSFQVKAFSENIIATQRGLHFLFKFMWNRRQTLYPFELTQSSYPKTNLWTRLIVLERRNGKWEKTTFANPLILSFLFHKRAHTAQFFSFSLQFHI